MSNSIILQVLSKAKNSSSHKSHRTSCHHNVDIPMTLKMKQIFYGSRRGLVAYFSEETSNAQNTFVSLLCPSGCRGIRYHGSSLLCIIYSSSSYFLIENLVDSGSGN